MKPLRQRELRLACLFLAPLALAACKGEKPAETGTAQGEVLPASVSDAMLPLDTVRSQPPLAPQTEATAGKPAPDTARENAAATTGDGEQSGEDEGEPAAAASASPDTSP